MKSRLMARSIIVRFAMDRRGCPYKTSATIFHKHKGDCCYIIDYDHRNYYVIIHRLKDKHPSGWLFEYYSVKNAMTAFSKIGELLAKN
jgi:hypothetical protein